MLPPLKVILITFTTSSNPVAFHLVIGKCIKI